jgi:hypothetical protein
MKEGEKFRMPVLQAFYDNGCGFECGRPAVGRTKHLAVACHNPATILPQLNAPPICCGFSLFRILDCFDIHEAEEQRSPLSSLTTRDKICCQWSEAFLHEA